MRSYFDRFQLTSSGLKIIAIITMLIDHIGAVLFPQQLILREIGRVSFPIFCFLLVEGFYHTSNWKRYALRLGAFALLSEIPYDLAFHNCILEGTHQNVFFTLLVGLVVLKLFEGIKMGTAEGTNGWSAKQLISIAGILGLGILSEMAHMDYGITGIVMIMIFYLVRNHSFLQTGLLALVNTVLMGNWRVQWYAVFAMIPISKYNGERGRQWKYGFYSFYPAHLIVLWLIGQIVS